MANPRIEEVDDDDFADDPEEMDVEAFDFARPQGQSLAPVASQAPPAMTQDDMEAVLGAQNQGQSARNAPMGQMPRMSDKERERMQREATERSKNYQCIYPVYFDNSRSRDEGRRVRKEDAVTNPLAREIVDALSEIGATTGVPLQIVFEPSKTHPKDWANPGRVRVQVKQDGRPISAKIKNKHHLYKLISVYLKSHPTTEDAPLKLQIQGMPMQKDKVATPAIPRGSKIGTILPLHSPALSGGGVSDDFMKDMMAQMGGQLPGMGGADFGGASAPAPKKIKDKKKK